MKIQSLIIATAFLSANAFSAVVVDVTKIVGKSQTEVAKLLGQPSSCSKSKYGKKCIYAKGDSEIVFINKKADWITIEAIDNVPFNKDALKSIGLKPAIPAFKNNFTLRWSNISGLGEVSIFKGAKNSDYAYIKAFTK
jgi:hypothetical protein